MKKDNVLQQHTKKRVTATVLGAGLACEYRIKLI